MSHRLYSECTIEEKQQIMIEQPDEQLVEAYLAGDQEVFSFLVDRYMKHLYNFVMQFVRDQNAAEDIVQETFVKAWKYLSRFDQNKSFKTWIFAIAKNTTYDYLKKKKTLPFSLFENEEGENALENTPAENDHPEDILDREATKEELEIKLAALAPLYRTILTLHYQEDFSLHEISKILDEPYNTVKSRHQRALQSLKKSF